MYKMYRKSILIIALFFTLFINQQIFADNSIPGANEIREVKTNDSKIKSINKGGFIYDIKKIDTVSLTKDIKELLISLTDRQYKMVKLLEKKKFKASDALITVVIPGGLLYAGFRMNEINRIRNILVAVSTEIGEFSNDLIALQGKDSDDSIVHVVMNDLSNGT